MKDLSAVLPADHAVALWNETVPAGTPVYRIDDFGRLHQTHTIGKAWVMPSSQDVVKCADVGGGYLLSRVWTREMMETFLDKYAPEGFEPITAY